MECSFGKGPAHILSCPSPVDFAVEQVTPIYSVCRHLHVQRHHVLQHGNDAGVVPFHQVYLTHLVPIGEDQVRALAYHRKSAHLSLQQLSQGLDSAFISQTAMELSVTDKQCLYRSFTPHCQQGETCTRGSAVTCRHPCGP